MTPAVFFFVLGGASLQLDGSESDSMVASDCYHASLVIIPRILTYLCLECTARFCGIRNRFNQNLPVIKEKQQLSYACVCRQCVAAQDLNG